MRSRSRIAGDLVLVLGDNVKRTWKQIIYFNSGAHGDEVATKAPVPIELPETEDFTFDAGTSRSSATSAACALRVRKKPTRHDAWSSSTHAD